MKENLNFFNEFLFRAENGSWFMKPICDFFGLDYDNQITKIGKDKICQSDVGKFPFEAVFGDKRPRVTLQDRGFARWVQMTSPSNIRVELREKFELFQANIFNHLWSGNTARVAQLEDIRQYALNINEAVRVKNHIMEYIGEQKNHRDLCLATPPDMWTDVKRSLTCAKQIPDGAHLLQPQLPANIGQLKLMKKNAQTNIGKHQHLLDYQCKTRQPEPNPMPEGYKREVHKLYIRNHENEIARIDMRIMELTGGKVLEEVTSC